MSGRPLDGEWDSFSRQRHEGFFWKSDLATRPGVSGEPANQKAEGPLLGSFITETDNNHKEEPKDCVLVRKAHFGGNFRRPELPFVILHFLLSNPAFGGTYMAGTEYRMQSIEQSGDPGETFVVLLAREERMLMSYVMTLVPHSQDADDILQNAKVIMWRNFAQFRLGTNFGAWARKIAFHQVLSHRKRKKRDCLEYSDEFLYAVAEEADAATEHLERRQRALNDCIARLPEDHRAVLRLRYYEGISIEALGERLDRTVAALYRLLSRVRRTLFDCVTRNLNRTALYETEPQPD